VKEIQKRQQAASDTLNQLLSDGKLAEKLHSDRKTFELFVNTLADYPANYDDNDILPVLEELFDLHYGFASEPGNFKWYKTWLTDLVELFLAWDPHQMPPVILRHLVTQLGRIAPYLRPSGRKVLGTSWQASDWWRATGRPDLEERGHYSKIREHALRDPHGWLADLVLYDPD
jgi:hypothetical protein